MNETDDGRFDDLVDQQLRHLRGEGPAPDLSTLNDGELAEVLEQLEIIDALADASPASPPLMEDPVAIRLGLVVGRTAAEPSDDPEADDDPVWISLCEVAARFGTAAVQAYRSDDSLPGPAGRQVRMTCRSLADVVAVIVFDSTEPSPVAADAEGWLRQRPELSAVAFTSSDATQASVVTAAEAARFLVPGVGWQTPGELAWEPLGIALGRHFDRSTPHWDEVAALPAGDLLEDLAVEAGAIATTSLDRVAGTRPRLEHKRHARDFVADFEVGAIVSLVNDVRARQLTGEDVVARVSEICRAAP